MADLDDFFAKKDRKKAKSKKFTTTEEIAKKMEETSVRERPRKEKMTLLPAPDLCDLPGSFPLSFQEDEEWKQFEEEKKDYTGLKIHNSNAQESNNSDGNDGDNEGNLEENDLLDSNSKKQNPWKVSENTEKQEKLEKEKEKEDKEEQEQEQEEEESAKKAEETSIYQPKKTYVLPQLRPQYRWDRSDWFPKAYGKQEAPDITNQNFFPTLSAALSETPASWSKKKQEAGFEEVRNSRSHSSRSDPTRTPQTLRIGNKFGALESENS